MNRFLKHQVARNAFGTVTHVRASNVHQGALAGWFDTEWRWMADPSISGCGGFGDLGTHVLDLLIWMFGDVARATAVIGPGTGRYPGCDEWGEAMIQFAGGPLATLAAGWDDVANPVTMQINGTEGNAVVFRDMLYFQSKRVAGADGKTAWTDLPEKLPHAFELFLDHLAGKRVPLVTIEEVAYRNVVMEALYRSAREKQWVSVE